MNINIDRMKSFTSILPLNEEKYNMLVSKTGLNGFRLIHHGHGNVALIHDDGDFKFSLESDTQRTIIRELNNNKK